MNKNLKLFLVVSLILCFIVFLYLRRKRINENFECAKIDNSLFCIKDKSEIDRFRKDQDNYYRVKVENFDFYNYINFELQEIINRNQRFNLKKNLTDTTQFKREDT